jgi:hypothetical protein
MTRSISFGNEEHTRGRTDAGWETVGDEVYNANPAFCDTMAGDYHLQAYSPAAPGVHFEARAGALGIGCVPDVAIVVWPSNFPIAAPADSHIVAACPAGDGPSALVSVDLNDDDMLSDVAAELLTVNVADFDTIKVFDSDGILTASSAATPANGFATVILHGNFGGFDVDSVRVMLNNWPLPTKALLDIRTPDAVAPFGNITAADFAYFGDSVYPKPYRWQSDFDGDGNVSAKDVAYFGRHYAHHTSLPVVNAVEGTAVSSTEVVLEFTTEFPTATQQRLFVDVSLAGISDVTTCVFLLRKSDDALTFVEWLPGEEAIGRVLFAPVTRDDSPELFFGVLVSESFGGDGSRLGRLVFEVAGTDPYEATDDEFVLTVGDVLVDAGGGLAVAAEISGVVGRRLDADVARIYHNRLEQNFPNPFNPNTTIAFSLQSAADVSLTIYDVAGRRVRELVNEKRNAGAYRSDWNGRNDSGQPVASGVYFYKLVAGTFTDTKKMTILK